MADNQPNEEHLLYYMLFHFGSGANATVGTKKISDAYGDVLKVILLPSSRANKESEALFSSQHAYQDGNTLRIPINETSTEDLLDKFMTQALSGLMAAIASRRLDQLDSDDRERVHRCLKLAATVPEYAKCVVKLLDRTKHIKRVNIIKKEPPVYVSTSGLSSIALNRKRGNSVGKSSKLDWVGGFRLARMKRSLQEVVKQSSYNIPTSDDDTFVAKIVRQMTKTVRKFKSKPGPESWRSAIQRIKLVGAEARAAKKRRDALKKRLRKLINNIPNKFQDAVKQMETMDQQINEQNKIAQRKRKEVRIPMNMLRESIKTILMASGKNVTNFDRKTLKLISPRFLSLVPEQNEDGLFNLLSPSLFSIHPGGREVEKAMSLHQMLKQLPNKDQEAWLDFIVETAGVTDAVDKAEKKQKEEREREMFGKDGVPLYFTKGNVTELFGDYEKRKIETFEALDKSYTAEQFGFGAFAYALEAAAVGTELGPSQTATIGDATKGFTTILAATLHRNASRVATYAIAYWASCRFDPTVDLIAVSQKDNLDKQGYAFLNSDQLELVYGPKSPYNKSDSLRLFQNLRRLNDDPHHLVERDIRALAEAKKFRVRQKDIALSPFVLSPLTFASAALSNMFIVLSPLVLSPVTLSPAVLGPIILSPWVFVPLVLSPRVLSPLIVNPIIFSPIVLSPLVLHPLILVPGVFNPLVLTPLVLSPLVLSPQVFSPLILSPMVLNPLILNPMAGSPLILSPFVLSPLIYSPQYLFAVILSPYALSPLIESELICSEVILSPSWLS
ncbi:hypothetical protein RB195_016489 [Necator americanus]|uniref:Uncharacterized protein n=1 Tax=Necator americanus TaxID=51031 RepID=A0ABR1C0Q3_NECAM